MHHAEEDHRTTRASVIGTISKGYEMEMVDLLEESDEDDTENDEIARLPCFQEVEMEGSESSDSDDKETHGVLARGDESSSEEEEDDTARIERMASSKLVSRVFDSIGRGRA